MMTMSILHRGQNELTKTANSRDDFIDTRVCLKCIQD